jgi:hypothetical protein
MRHARTASMSSFGTGVGWPSKPTSFATPGTFRTCNRSRNDTRTKTYPGKRGCCSRTRRSFQRRTLSYSGRKHSTDRRCICWVTPFSWFAHVYAAYQCGSKYSVGIRAPNGTVGSVRSIAIAPALIEVCIIYYAASPRPLQSHLESNPFGNFGLQPNPEVSSRIQPASEPQLNSSRRARWSGRSPRTCNNPCSNRSDARPHRSEPHQSSELPRRECAAGPVGPTRAA